MKLYVSGPTYTGSQRAALRQAIAGLKAGGAEVSSALDTLQELGMMVVVPTNSARFALVRGADAVVALPGWETSPSALAEVALAMALGIPFRRWQDLPSSAVLPPTA